MSRARAAKMVGCATSARRVSAVLRWVFVCGLPKLRCTVYGRCSAPFSTLVSSAQLKVFWVSQGLSGSCMQVCGGHEHVQGVAVEDACCAFCDTAWP